MGSGTAQAGARDRVSLVPARAAITLDDAPPKIALDADGYATALPADAKGLAVPNSIAAAVNDNFATGGRQEGRIFPETAVTKRQRQVHQDGETWLRPLGRTE
jgi:hypothetical protein